MNKNDLAEIIITAVIFTFFCLNVLAIVNGWYKRLGIIADIDEIEERERARKTEKLKKDKARKLKQLEVINEIKQNGVEKIKGYKRVDLKKHE